MTKQQDFLNKIRSGAGQAIKYNAYMIDNNYAWICQPRGSGYGYMATGNAKNGKRVDYWGSFS